MAPLLCAKTLIWIFWAEFFKTVFQAHLKLWNGASDFDTCTLAVREVLGSPFKTAHNSQLHTRNVPLLQNSDTFPLYCNPFPISWTQQASIFSDLRTALTATSKTGPTFYCTACKRGPSTKSCFTICCNWKTFSSWQSGFFFKGHRDCMFHTQANW